MINKNVSLDIPCPKCGVKVKKTLKELGENPIGKCSNGHEFKIDSTGLTKGLKGVEDTIKQIQNKNKR